MKEKTIPEIPSFNCDWQMNPKDIKWVNGYFVSPDGDDNNDGSFKHPFKTIKKAEET